MNKKIVYSIVTPVKNEIKSIKESLHSVINQTITPQKWVIVNDGSTDGTEKILNEYEKKYDWLEIISFIDKGYKEYKSVHLKLKMALEKILQYKNDYIVKMDGDLSFNNNYFENVFHKFEENPKLGIAGGWFFSYENNNLIPETHSNFHVRGGSKIYKWECWKEIGGFVNKLGYDTIDEVTANMKGWATKSFKDIQVIHHRKTGGSKGSLRWNIYTGKLKYLVWYHPLFTLIKSLKKIISEKPYILAGLFHYLGFISCYLKRTPRSIYDKEFIKYIRKEQIKKITFRSTIWN